MVAACLDIAERRKREEKLRSRGSDDIPQEYLTPEEIRDLALKSRQERADHEEITPLKGDTFKGSHTVRNARNVEYTVTIYNPNEMRGHCTCPDFATNHLDTCKHLIFTCRQLEKENDFPAQAAEEVFPFVHFTCNSRLYRPVVYYERIENPEFRSRIDKLFNEKGVYTRESIKGLYELYSEYSDDEDLLRFDDYLLERMEDILWQKEAARLEKRYSLDFTFLKTELYPYQAEGVRFAVFKKAAAIADEMGLGKTLQAIAIALIKKDIFGFEKILSSAPPP